MGLTPVLGQAAPQPPAVVDATYSFTWSEHDLTGPGADHLRQAAQHAQFVLIGEEHHDRNTPLFTRALYAVLRREDGFDHLAVEQDPLGVELALVL
jgi:erythromycin esterase-like protein